MLDDFDAGDLLGVGGMARVVAATHRPTGGAVAVKALDRGGNARSHALWEHEVRVIASMDHPHILRVYDQGVTQRPWGPLEPGTPVLVMQRGAATLADQAPQGWSEVRDVLLAVLSGLAHAHARGVVHRDIKPSNVLLLPGPPSAIRLRIADFGIAWTREARVGHAGSPRYMAPEQIAGGDYGPWTDLYSAGCLAWELLTGDPPFPYRDVDTVLRAHLAEPLPAFEPRMAVPDGIEPWLRTTLARAPSGRYRRAADAAYALEHLQASSSAGWSHLSRALATETLLEPYEAPDALPEQKAPPPRPFDPRWHDDVSGLLERSTDGLGLRLVGMRRGALIGRRAEQAALWAVLEEAAAGARRVVHLAGPARVGTTRLARWFVERAHELGIAYRADREEPERDRVALHWFDGLAPVELPEGERSVVLLSGCDAPAQVDLRLTLQPLDETETALLVRDVLRLAPDLAVRVEEDCEGFPGRALAQVEAWAQQDRLRPGPLGYQLRAQTDDAPRDGSKDDTILAWRLAHTAEHLVSQERYRQALRVLSDARALAPDPPEDLAAHIEALDLFARAEMGPGPSLVEAANALRERARARGWHRIDARMSGLCGSALKFGGRIDEAMAEYSRAEAAWLAAGEVVEAAHTMMSRAMLHSSNDPARARRLYEQVLQTCRDAGHRGGQSLALRRMAILHDEAGDPAEALALCEQALAALDGAWPQRQAQVQVTRGHALLHLKRVDEASDAFERARQLFDAGGSMEGLLARVNLALCDLERAEWSRARFRLETALERMLKVTGGRRTPTLKILSALLLPAVAGEGDDAALAEHLDVVRAADPPDRYGAPWIERAADLAHESRRADLLRVALSHYQGLNDQEAMERVRGRLSASP